MKHTVITYLLTLSLNDNPNRVEPVDKVRSGDILHKMAGVKVLPAAFPLFGTPGPPT